MRRSMGDREPPEDDDEEIVANFVSSRSSSSGGGSSDHWGIELEKKQLEIEDLQKVLATLRKQNNELAARDTETNSRLMETMERFDQAQHLIAELEGNKRDLQRRLEDLDKETTAKIKALEQGLDDFTDQNQKISTLTREVQDRQEELKEVPLLRETIAKLEKALHDARNVEDVTSPGKTTVNDEILAAKDAEISELRQKVGGLEGQLRVLGAKLQNMTLEKEELEGNREKAESAEADWLSNEGGVSRKDMMAALAAEQDRYRLLRMLTSALVYRAQTSGVLKKNS